MFQRDRCTLPSHNETGYAVRDTGACCQESNAHDDIRDSQSVPNYSHLRGTYRVSELKNSILCLHEKNHIDLHIRYSCLMFPYLV